MALANAIGEQLVPRVVFVTKGCDILFGIQRADEDGNTIDWDSEVYVSIDIDHRAPTRVDTEITGSLAVVRVESPIADQVRNSTTWQAIRSEAGSPTLELPVAVGVFRRQDGK